MSLIDYTYFVRDINVPINNASDTDASYSGLVKSIEKYEEEVLKKLLGYTLWKALDDDLDENDEPQTEPYVSLVNGAEFSFTYYGQTINTKWGGLVNSSKSSLIANYVYYYHRKNNITSYTGIGESIAKSENSIIADPTPKLVRAWNEMVKSYGVIPYPQVLDSYYFLNNDNYVHYNADPSAYNYLLANISDFGDWVFTPLRKKHSLF